MVPTGFLGSGASAVPAAIGTGTAVGAAGAGAVVAAGAGAGAVVAAGAGAGAVVAAGAGAGAVVAAGAGAASSSSPHATANSSTTIRTVTIGRARIILLINFLQTELSGLESGRLPYAAYLRPCSTSWITLADIGSVRRVQTGVNRMRTYTSAWENCQDSRWSRACVSSVGQLHVGATTRSLSQNGHGDRSEVRTLSGVV